MESSGEQAQSIHISIFLLFLHLSDLLKKYRAHTVCNLSSRVYTELINVDLIQVLLKKPFHKQYIGICSKKLFLKGYFFLKSISM